MNVPSPNGGPDEPWSTGTTVVRGILYAVTGAGIAWWAWPEPTDSAAMGFLTFCGLALMLLGVGLVVFGIVRALSRAADGPSGDS